MSTRAADAAAIRLPRAGLRPGAAVAREERVRCQRDGACRSSVDPSAHDEDRCPARRARPRAGMTRRSAPARRRAVLHHEGAGPRARTGPVPRADLRRALRRFADAGIATRARPPRSSCRPAPSRGHVMTAIEPAPATRRTLLVVDDDDAFRTRLVRAFARPRVRRQRRGGLRRGDGVRREPTVRSWRSSICGCPAVRPRRRARSQELDQTTNIVVLTGYGSIH